MNREDLVTTIEIKDRKGRVVETRASQATRWTRARDGCRFGPVNASSSTPEKVFKAAITLSAASILVSHNHSSGDPTPEEDLALRPPSMGGRGTSGHPLLDHVIVGEGEYRSSQGGQKPISRAAAGTRRHVPKQPAFPRPGSSLPWRTSSRGRAAGGKDVFTTGTLHLGVIRVGFNNLAHPAEVTDADIEGFLFTNSGNVRDLYREMSYNQ
jgi:hypothetical protein